MGTEGPFGFYTAVSAAHACFGSWDGPGQGMTSMDATAVEELAVLSKTGHTWAYPRGRGWWPPPMEMSVAQDRMQERQERQEGVIYWPTVTSRRQGMVEIGQGALVLDAASPDRPPTGTKAGSPVRGWDVAYDCGRTGETSAPTPCWNCRV
jgi:hypothetical protein